jgi:hypothetical protein
MHKTDPFSADLLEDSLDVDLELPHSEQQREELRRWNRRKIEALALRHAVPIWPMYILVFFACIAPAFEAALSYTQALIWLAFGWTQAQVYCLLRSAYLERQASRQMQAGIRRLIGWQPGTAQ